MIGITDCYFGGKERCCLHHYPLTAKEIEKLARGGAKTPTPQQVQSITATGGSIIRDKKGRIRLIPD